MWNHDNVKLGEIKTTEVCTTKSEIMALNEPREMGKMSPDMN